MIKPEQVWEPVGKLILAHASVEVTLFVVLLRHSGLPFEEANDLYEKDARIGECKKTIRRFLRDKGESLERLEDIFAQLSLITNVRNGISHYQTMYTEDGILVDTSLVYGEEGVRNHIPLSDFDDMLSDLKVIEAWIHYNALPPDLLTGAIDPVHAPNINAFTAHLASVFRSPFLYKPVRQFQRRQRIRRNYQ